MTRVIGRDIGSLPAVVAKFKAIYDDPPTPAFNSEHYLEWVNTQLPGGLLLEVDRLEREPFYLWTVRLTIQPTATREGERFLNSRTLLERYQRIETWLELSHREPTPYSNKID